MSTHSFTSALALLLTVSIIVPSAFLIAPQPVKAQYAVVEVGQNLITNLKTTVESTITAVQSTLSTALNVTNTAATVAMKINEYFLQPLAFALSGDLLKLITAGVINFVIGKTNGTGVPQFVVDVQKSMQTVGDARALSFFDQFGRNSNSPFASSISSSLRRDYLSKTTLAGFWAANMNTLAASTPSYAPGYLAGNWQQGGIRAWFALTTQVQNNPYTFYQNSQDQLGTLIGPGVGGATGARMAELGWGSGFGSWCGTSDTSTAADRDDRNAVAPVATGVNPGDPCTDKDGNPGTIRTPGSVIVASLNKVLGGQQDQVLRMGNVGPQINQILKNISTVMQTVNFATNILGNASLASATGGLLGADEPSSSGATSPLRQYQNSPGNLGVTSSSIYQSAATSPEGGTDMSSRIAQYQSAWGSISAATNAASSTIANLINFCTDAIKTNSDDSVLINNSTVQINAARAALTDEIAPVLARVAAAASTIAAAQAMVVKVQNELNAGTTTAGSAYLTDVQTLQTMSPTMSDVANVQQEVQAFNMAAASPAGSLAVSGGSLIDQMALISTNAEALKVSCNPVPPVNSGGGD